jgi:hypothetical protein
MKSATAPLTNFPPFPKMRVNDLSHRTRKRGMPSPATSFATSPVERERCLSRFTFPDSRFPFSPFPLFPSFLLPRNQPPQIVDCLGDLALERE